MTEPSDIFISYARADHAVVDEFRSALTSAGLPVWVDVGALRGGERWRVEIARALKASKVVVLICSKASFASRYVHDEMAVADAADPRPVIVPVFVEPVEITDELELMIRARHWVDLTQVPRAEWSNRLVAELSRTDLPTQPRRSALDRPDRPTSLSRRTLLVGGTVTATAIAAGLVYRSRPRSAEVTTSGDSTSGDPTPAAPDSTTPLPVDSPESPTEPQVLWERSILGDPPFSIGISNRTVTFQDSMQSIVVLDARSGDEAYQLQIPDTGGFSKLTAQGGFIYALHDFDGIKSLHEENLLNEERGSIMAQSLDVPLDVIFGGVSIVNDLLIVSTLEPPYGSGIYGDLDLAVSSFDLRAFDRLTGEAVWQGGPTGFDLSAQDDGVYSIDDAGTVWAFETSTGEVRWTAPVAGVGQILGTGSRQPVVSLAGDEVAAFNPQDGTELWRDDAPEAVNLAAGAGVAYVGTTSRIWAVSAVSGAELWTLDLDSVGGIALDAGWLYVFKDRQITGVDPQTGALRWTKDLDQDLMFANTANGTLAAVLVGDESRVVAYGPPA